MGVGGGNGPRVMPMKRWGVYGNGNVSIGAGHGGYSYNGGSKDHGHKSPPNLGVIGLSNNAGGKENYGHHGGNNNVTSKLPSLHFAPMGGQMHGGAGMGGMMVVNGGQAGHGGAVGATNLPSLYHASNGDKPRMKGGNFEKDNLMFPSLREKQPTKQTMHPGNQAHGTTTVLPSLRREPECGSLAI
ncbi:hypothetical protein BC829DRAFT_409742, partial [Chytridium lagenaria]